MTTPDATAIAAHQSDLTALWHQQEPSAQDAGLMRLVTENHLRNFLLWHEEDVARRDDLGSQRVHQAKRAIDQYNQQRNNFIEEIDQELVSTLRPSSAPDCPQNSETPGMIIDRLSIMALKAYHMHEETARADADEAHRAACGAKLKRLLQQRGDLTCCLAELLAQVQSGTRTFGVYYQFKMYNDPALNPELYQAASQRP